MEIKTVNQFVALVGEMRRAQKKRDAVFTPANVKEAAMLERQVDSAISQREKNRIQKEKAKQQTLF